MTAYWPTGGSDPNATPVMREYAGIWNALPKVVFSRTLESVDYGCRLRTGDIGEELAKLREEFDGDIEVSGPNIGVAVHRARPGRRVPRRRPSGDPRRGHPVLPEARARRSGSGRPTIERFESGVVALTYVAA